jgi:hypothetical protein
MPGARRPRSLSRTGQRYTQTLAEETVDVEEAIERETSLCGLNHCDAGALLAEAWGFPEQLRIAERTDPLSSRVHSGLAWVLLSAGRYDVAAEQCLKMSAGHALTSLCLARARLGQGRNAEAVQLLANDRSAEGPGFLGYAYARSGRRDEAERLAVANSERPDAQVLIFAGLGDKDGTLKALDRMAVLGPLRIGKCLNYPEMAVIRGDPRLKALRQKVGLPE